MGLIAKVASKAFICEKCSKYAKACRKEHILQTKPQRFTHTINPQEIRCEIAFGKPLLIEDKTLNKDFLKSLLEIKGTVLERITEIKNRMLKTMGYNPEIVKIEATENISSMAFQGDTGKLLVNSNIAQIVPQHDLIATIRHELDHFEKYVGIIQKEGIEKFKLCYRPDVRIQGYFNEDFLNSAQQAKKIGIFDSKKYVNACENLSTHSQDMLLSQINYFSNALEENAYNLQRQIGKIFDSKYFTVRDLVYQKNIKSVNELLNKLNMPVEEKNIVFTTLLNHAMIYTRPNAKELFSLLRQPEFSETELNMLQQLNTSLQKPEIYKDALQQVETWLRQGVTKIEDIPL